MLGRGGSWGGGGGALPLTTLGDLVYEDANPAPARLPGNITASKQFLTQTGTGLVSAAPAWSALAPSDIPLYDPTFAFILFDDFVSGGYFGSGQIQCAENWASIVTGSPSFSANGGTITSSNAHPGVLQISIAALNEGGGFLTAVFGSATNSCIYVGGGVLTLECLVYINALSNGTDNGDFGFGIMDSPMWVASTNQISIQYKVGTSVNWLLLTEKASSLTTTTSSVAVTAGWHHLKMVVNAAGTSVEGFVDGVSLGTASTNIPLTTTKLPIMASYRKVLGTGAMVVGIDYIKATNVFTSAR